MRTSSSRAGPAGKAPEPPVPDFLGAFQERRREALEPFLDEAVVYQVDGFEPVVGRRAVLAYWRRMFDLHETVRMSLARHVRDGEVAIAAVHQLYLARSRPPLVLESLTVFELQGERIRQWSDHLAGEVPEETAALWRRLRAARW